MDSATFADPAVVGFSRDFVFTKIDGSVDTLLARKMAISGYPTNILFRPDGREIDRLWGYFPADSFLIEIKNYLAGINTLEDYLKRVAAQPDDLDLHITLGEKYSARRAFGDARTHYERVRELDTNNEAGLADDASYYLAYLLRKEEDWYAAIDGFRAMIKNYPDSELRELADILLDMGEIEEPCALGLTPSASIAVMLAISDALALTLMELKNVTKHDYGLRHHGGYLGRKARTNNE